MDLRKAFPWIVSLGLHAAVLVVPLGFLMAPATESVGVIGVDISLVGGGGAGSGGRWGSSRSGGPSRSGGASRLDGAMYVEGVPGSGEPDAPMEGSDVVRAPRPGTRQGGKGAASLPKVSTELPDSVLAMEETDPVESAAVFSLPSARDILADVAALSGSGARKPAMTGSGGASSATGTQPAGSGSAVAGGHASAVAGSGVGTGNGDGTGAGGVSGASGTRIGWEGTARKLIRKRDPRFPDVLAATGQEVDGEARITVAPSGVVTRVEMTRSTGYSEIDSVIEAALRDYLFSRVDGKRDAMGTVRFRFRLERRD